MLEPAHIRQYITRLNQARDSRIKTDNTVDLTLIDDGFDIVLQWLTIKSSVSNDLQALEAKKIISLWTDLPSRIICDLGGYIFIRVRTAQVHDERTNRNECTGYVVNELPTIIDRTKLNARLGQKIIAAHFFSNEKVFSHYRRFEFNCYLINLHFDYLKFSDIGLMLSKLPPNEIKRLIKEISPMNMENLVDGQGHNLLLFIKNFTNSYSYKMSEFELINLFIEQFPDNFDILMAQNEILCGLISDSAIRSNASDITNKILSYRQMMFRDELKKDKNIQILKCTNRLLLSQPGDEQNTIICQYESIINKVRGGRSQIWQGVGVLMMILGVGIIGLGIIAISSPGSVIACITTGVAMMALGLYLLTSNIQKEHYYAMQNLLNHYVANRVAAITLYAVPGEASKIPSREELRKKRMKFFEEKKYTTMPLNETEDFLLKGPITT